ncbi:MAG: extracellular solute-binding protein [Patescibacteria group bacterium]
MRLSSRSVLLLVLGVVAVGGVVAGILLFRGPSNTVALPKAVTLTYWRVFDEQEDIQSYIDAYQTEFPYVKIGVRNFTLDEYEEALISAWAKGEGPDMYSIPNYWLGKYVQYSAPLPAELSLVRITERSRLGRKEVLSTRDQVRGLSVQEVKNGWVDAVAEDVVFDDQVYGLPYSIDTMVMYYNKDLLAQAGIAVPPALWADFVDDVPKISVINETDEILRSGTAMGTHGNVQRYFDLLSILMMQNGATMADGNSARFNIESDVRPGYYPGLAATTFYTDFANPRKSVYSWTEEQPDSLESFTNGQTAFFFGYWYHLAEIQKRSPSLNFGIAPIPQISSGQQVNYANYWVESVAASSPNQDLAWAFIQAVAKGPQTYLLNTGRPAALRTEVAKQQADPILATFANQALTAKTWYHGSDPETAEKIFAELIDAIRLGTSEEPLDTVDIAARQISQTLELSE